MIAKEDQTAPISEREISETSKNGSLDEKRDIVIKILSYFKEKRDQYNGVVSSVIYIIDTQDYDLIKLLDLGIIKLIASNPMSFGGKVFLTKALHRLVQERPQYVASLFESFIRDSMNWKSGFGESDILRLKIIALKAIRLSERKARRKLTSLLEREFDTLCDEAIVKCDDTTRVDTLSLVLDTNITTKILEQRELDIFKKIFIDALTFQDPSLRQVLMATTSKLIKRISDGHRVVMRIPKQMSSSRDDDLRHTVTKRYMQFLEWLIKFCFDNIYCNAYFGSFILTISTLKRVIEHVNLDNQGLRISQFFNNRRCYDSILSCLNDSFEENKLLALELLILLPYNDQFINEGSIETFEEIGYQLVASINPAHSLTCQYVFKLLVSMKLKMLQSQNEPTSRNKLVYHYLDRLVGLVELGVRETQENFIIALKYNAIYPKLTCIRGLLNEVDINDLNCRRSEWKELTKRIVQASIEACQAVSTIVCNLNPETIGHLPMDLKELNVGALTKSFNVSMKISENQLQTITSQMLLISGWKTIKECSLSMGVMCIRFWWPSQRIKAKLEKFPGFDYPPILDSREVLQIINFFDHYLRNLRHRGAFEQAYNGFMMVTKRVWHEPELRQVLISTLTDIMNDFKNGQAEIDDRRIECLKAYVTRRSAGLPFIVQAIVKSEHKYDSEILSWVMESLFEVLENSNSETYQRIHCLNILKALIKEHQLGEKVVPFIGRTFAITMEAFKSDSFPIRNCANMLLKAVIDRTFGVNRLRDDIHKRNKLSYEKFFSECPDLHPKMLNYLEDGLGDRKSLASVHSVFTILSRLVPSLNASEQYSSDKVIKPFIEPSLKLALTCPDFKLRELAAKLVVQFEAYCDNGAGIESRCRKLRQLIYEDESVIQHKDKNRLHGALLLLKHLLDTSCCPQLFVKLEHTDQLSDFTHQVVEDILTYEPANQFEDFAWKSLQMTALDIVEIHCLFELHHRRIIEWPNILIKRFRHERRLKSEPNIGLPKESIRPPHYEQFYFKLLTTILMNIYCVRASVPMDNDDDRRVIFTEIWEALLEEVDDCDLATSTMLRSGFVRFLRHLLVDCKEEFTEKLMDSFGMDLPSGFTTSFDRMKLAEDNERKYALWSSYCSPAHLARESPEPPLNSFFKTYGMGAKLPEYIRKYSNTPLCVERLALARQLCYIKQIAKSNINICHSVSISPSILTEFISTLPDCHARCFALLLGAQIVLSNMRQLHDDKISNVSHHEFTSMVENLSNGHHDSLTRETCVEVLRIILFDLVWKQKRPFYRRSLINALSALIRLSQDEESEIRLKCCKVASDLALYCRGEDERDTLYDSLITESIGRLDSLVELIILRVFNPQCHQDVLDCLELSLRIILDHSNDCTVEAAEEREQLFDKTKLYSFTDHVATIECVLSNLTLFMRYRRSTLILDVNCLKIPKEMQSELENNVTSAKQMDSTVGDYSWRLKMSNAATTTTTAPAATYVEDENKEDNNCRLTDRVLFKINQSLNYFSRGYQNMLTDAEYTHHEVSLFKRVAFVKFIMHCTNYKPQNGDILNSIRVQLEKIVATSCSTTMLCKCLELTSSIEMG